MAIASRMILPSVPPICSSADNRRGRGGHRGFHRRRRSQGCAKITFPQKPKRYICGTEVIHAGIQTPEIATHDIQFDFVESSGTSCGTKVDFSTWIRTLFCNPRREIEEACQILN